MTGRFGRGLAAAAAALHGAAAPVSGAEPPPPPPPAADGVCARDGVYEEEGRICFVGLVDRDRRDAVLALMERVPGDLFIRSRGGDVALAWDIGRRMHAEARGLVVLGPCYSSCANYLVPAAARVEVRRGGLILLHGSPPRDRVTYAVSVARRRGLDPRSSEDLPAIQQILDSYPGIHRDFIVPEAQYFVDIAATDGFVVRYWEVLRNIELYSTTRCRGDNVFVIVGPRYLHDIARVPASGFWWPENRQELVDLLPEFSSDVNLVFDVDLLPGWIAGRGLVRQADCLRDLDAIPPPHGR